MKKLQWIWVLVGWTFFLWLSRLRNVVNNDELTSSGRAVRIGVVVIFVVMAVAVAVALRRNAAWLAQATAVFLAWTVGYWLIRGIGILVDGQYDVGFKAVHTVLMVVSVTLCALTARQLRPAR